ncbi:hypothetical protein [Actinokineospora sp. NPDC004072]
MIAGDSTAGGEPVPDYLWSGDAEWSADYNPRLALLKQSWVMIDHIARSGIQPPAAAFDVVERARRECLGEPPAGEPVTLGELAEAHGLLAKAVAPATPSTIQLLADERPGRIGRYFGPTKYARLMSVVAIIAFALFGIGQGVLATGTATGWLDVGLTALASIIGGLFYVMFDLSRQLKNGSFRRSLEGHYTILVILGGLSGTVLALLVIQPQDDQAGVAVLLTRPLIALVGGFSAEAVHRILQRLASTVVALVNGSGEELVEAARTRADAQVLTAKTATVQDLIALNATLTDPAARAEVDKLVAKVLSGLPAGQPGG